MNRFDVQHRDCFDSLAAARDAGGARLIVTSPPYPDARTVEQYGGASFDTTLAGYGRLGEACFDALVPGGVVALNIDGPVRVWRDSWCQAQSSARVSSSDGARSERSLIAFKLAIDWAERIGFRYVERCAYVKRGISGAHGPRWSQGFELIHVLQRPGGKCVFNAANYKVPAAKPGRSWGGSRARWSGGWVSTRGYTASEDRCLTTAFSIDVNPGNVDHEHPAPFARELADAFVLCYSQPDDLVCDPFVGSGTVAFSCHRHGRRFVGGDLGHRETHHGKPCGRRWADIVNDGLRQTTLFEAVAQ